VKNRRLNEVSGAAWFTLTKPDMTVAMEHFDAREYTETLEISLQLAEDGNAQRALENF